MGAEVEKSGRAPQANARGVGVVVGAQGGAQARVREVVGAAVKEKGGPQVEVREVVGVKTVTHAQDAARRLAGDAALRTLTTRDLASRIAAKAGELARKEVELAKAEVRADVKTELRVAGGLGIAGVCLLMTLQLLLVAVVLALQESGLLAGWLAALLVAAAVLLVGTATGLTSWKKRVKNPMEATRRSARDGVRWVKEQVR